MSLKNLQTSTGVRREGRFYRLPFNPFFLSLDCTHAFEYLKRIWSCYRFLYEVILLRAMLDTTDL